MLVERIDQYLIGKEKKIDDNLLKEMKFGFDNSITRQLMEVKEGSGTGNLRCSNPGPCARQMAYGLLGFPKSRDYEPRTLLTWLFGDIIELTAAAIIRLSGVVLNSTILDEEGQAEGFFNVGNGLLVPGHTDGIIPVQEGVCDEPYLLEIKSSSDYGFKREWLKNNPGKRYELQHQVYLDMLGLDKGVFFVINKNTGHYHEVLTEKNESLVEEARQNYEAAGFATPEQLPPRYEDGKDYGRKIDKEGNVTETLAWGCTYCDFLHSCWPNVEVTFERGKPVHKVKDMGAVDKTDLYLDL